MTYTWGWWWALSLTNHVTPFPLIYIYIPRAVVELELNPPPSLSLSLSLSRNLDTSMFSFPLQMLLTFFMQIAMKKNMFFFLQVSSLFYVRWKLISKFFLKKKKTKKIDRDGLIMIKDGILLLISDLVCFKKKNSKQAVN